MVKHNVSQRNSLLNFFKGIGCVGVVWIHVMFPGAAGRAVSTLAAFAVPLFFMISGYFAYSLDDCEVIHRLKRRLVRITKITIWSMSLYMSYKIAFVLYTNTWKEWLCDLNTTILWRFILLNDLDFIGGGHLWFLFALAYLYLLLILADKYRLYIIMYKLLPCFFILHIIVRSISRMGYCSWHISSNFFCTAIPYVVMGNYIAYKKEFQNRWDNHVLGCLAAVSMVFSCICSVYSQAFPALEIVIVIGIVISAILIFLVAVRNPYLSVNKQIEFLGENYSLYVYIIHNLIAYIMGIFLAKMGMSDCAWMNWIKPVCAAFFSIICSRIIYGFIKERFRGKQS